MGLFCIYVKWKISPEVKGVITSGPHSWFEDHTPLLVFVTGNGQEPDQDPERGVYGTLEDARREMRALRGFPDAILKPRL